MHKSSDQSYSIVFFLLDCSLWKTLDSEVYFKVPYFPRPPQVSVYWFHADDNLCVELARHPSGYFLVVDVVIRKHSDTESLKFWCSPLFEDGRLAQSHEGK